MASSCCSGGQAGMGHAWAAVGLKEGLGGAIFMDILGRIVGNRREGCGLISDKPFRAPSPWPSLLLRSAR